MSDVEWVCNHDRSDGLWEWWRRQDDDTYRVTLETPEGKVVEERGVWTGSSLPFTVVSWEDGVMKVDGL